MVQNLTKEQRIARAKLAGESKRSDELKLAWLESNKIQTAYKLGVSVTEISDKYKINQRATYRIIKAQ